MGDHEDSVDELMKVKPTTLAGAVALLDFWWETNPIKNGDMRWHERVMENVLAALKKLTTH